MFLFLKGFCKFFYRYFAVFVRQLVEILFQLENVLFCQGVPFYYNYVFRNCLGKFFVHVFQIHFSSQTRQTLVFSESSRIIFLKFIIFQQFFIIIFFGVLVKSSVQQIIVDFFFKIIQFIFSFSMMCYALIFLYGGQEPFLLIFQTLCIFQIFILAPISAHQFPQIIVKIFVSICFIYLLQQFFCLFFGILFKQSKNIIVFLN
ncbi:hypothetical protein PPERSA_10246 [Pseudocohnilembus persalinus]|uniref:Transmembrane protein n=1 Tax=Pseudocohnilembus persalinus TaxID=266149 RepID=A0A0V0QZZ4_PSEPJ|nr:hypothetical protein PPERSA_10246 [Pseudocohnilembus persalinus]|eukprot:KRX07858.1 hypothetical protein PPERSA_10246 [Pseudocohnilembus persalinus]